MVGSGSSPCGKSGGSASKNFFFFSHFNMSNRSVEKETNLMKSTKKRLLIAKEKTADVLSILNAKSKGADLSEYIMTIKFILGVINEYLGVKDKYRPKIHDDAEKIWKLSEEYYEMLSQLVKTGER